MAIFFRFSVIITLDVVPKNACRWGTGNYYETAHVSNAYVRCNPCRLDLQEKKNKMHQKSQSGFILKLKPGVSSGQGLLPTVGGDEKLLC